MNSTERELLHSYFEGILRYSPIDTWDEGIGTVYERMVMERWFQQLTTEHGIKRVLEFPCDGITGLLGINSFIFARIGCEVYLANPNAKVVNAVNGLWKKTSVSDRYALVRTSEDQPLPFPDNFFDLAWNFCMLERYSDPLPLIREMARTSKLLLLITQNWKNWGTVPHLIWHRYKGRRWDHGHRPYMTLPGIKKLVKACDLRLVGEGALDIPPIIDTWDTPIRGTLAWLLRLLRRDWSWKRSRSVSVLEAAPKSRLTKAFLWLEDNLPTWFKKYQAHHLYVLVTK